jgi:hypothetical protein
MMVLYAQLALMPIDLDTRIGIASAVGKKRELAMICVGGLRF